MSILIISKVVRVNNSRNLYDTSYPYREIRFVATGKSVIVRLGSITENDYRYGHISGWAFCPLLTEFLWMDLLDQDRINRTFQYEPFVVVVAIQEVIQLLRTEMLHLQRILSEYGPR